MADDALPTRADPAITVDALATDGASDSLRIISASAEDSATGTAAVVVENGRTVVVFTPAKNYRGLATVNYTISDGHGGTDTAVLMIDVAPVKDAPKGFFVVWREQKLEDLVRHSGWLVEKPCKPRQTFLGSYEVEADAPAPNFWDEVPDEVLDKRVEFWTAAHVALDAHGIHGDERDRIGNALARHIPSLGHAFEGPADNRLPDPVSPVGAMSTKKWIEQADAFALIKQSVALPLDPLPFSERLLTEAAAAKLIRMKGRERRLVNGEVVLGNERKIKPSCFSKPHSFTDTGISRFPLNPSAEMIFADRADQFRGGSALDYTGVFVDRDKLERTLEGDRERAEGEKPPNAVTRQAVERARIPPAEPAPAPAEPASPAADVPMAAAFYVDLEERPENAGKPAHAIRELYEAEAGRRGLSINLWKPSGGFVGTFEKARRDRRGELGLPKRFIGAGRARG